MSFIGSLCVVLLLIFSVYELIKNLGSWTSIDYIWLAAIILFIIGFLGDYFQKRVDDDSDQNEIL